MGQETNIYFILFAGTTGMLMLAVGIVTFVVIYQKRLIRHRQSLQELELKQQQELLYTHLQAQEQERTRVAADLHDEVGATLAALRLSIADIQRSASSVGTEIFSKATSLADKAINSVRQISHGLTPSGLEIFGLAALLEDLSASLSSQTVEISFSSSGNIPRLPHQTELSLYRIAQEMINNALKHSSASEILIELRRSEGLIILSCRDNGKGFNTNVAGKGIGLLNMKNRAKMIHAALNIESSEAGTVVEISMPLNNK